MKRLLVFCLCLGIIQVSSFGQRIKREDIKKSHEEFLSKVPRKSDRSFIPQMYYSPTPFPVYKVNQYPNEAPQNEPSVRVNPKDPNNIVAAYRDFRLGWEPAIRNVSIATTTDGGLTWIEQLAQYSDHDRYSDPAVAVDTSGYFYVVTLDYNDLYWLYQSTLSVRKSFDGGLTWMPAIPTDPPGFHDKEMIYVDDSPVSPYCDNVYISYRADIIQLFTRSTDGGFSFTSPLDIYDRAGWASTPSTGPNGELYIAGLATVDGNDVIKLTKSTDGGISFSPTTIVSDFHVPVYFLLIDGNISSLGAPVVAVDKSNSPRRGTVYVVYLSTFYGDGDLFCTRSTDIGATWSTAFRVNNDTVGNHRDQFHFWMTVDDSGWVDVVFLDRRNDPNNILCDAYFAQSRDGGNTFKNFKLTAQNFDPRIYPNGDVRYGEYIGIDARQSRIVPIWVDTHLGNQDIYIATIDQEQTASIQGTVSSNCLTGNSNWPILLFHDNGIDSTFTDSEGKYSFTGLFPGTYIVSEDVRNGWEQTYPISPNTHTVVIGSTEVVTGKDFVNYWNAQTDGWYLLSMPLLATDSRASTIFPDASSKAFTYQSSYVIRDSLQFGIGYWLKFDCAELTIPTVGDSVKEDSIDVNVGWNMIGSLSVPLRVTSITSDPGGIIASPFFDYIDQNYTEVDSLQPGIGHWVKCGEPGKLILSSTTNIPLASSVKKLDTEKLNNITIEDGAHHKRTLFFGKGYNDDEILSWTELPPKPPAGGFDVRFASQRTTELISRSALNELILPIDLQVTSFPLNISWNIIEEGIEYQLMPSVDGNTMKAINLKDEGKISLDIKGIDRLVLSAKSSQRIIPTEYSLNQNTPNPFNPLTIIHYQLPADNYVTLKVYNILGEEVRTLVNEFQVAGFKSIEMDASTLPSGVYFYRMTAHPMDGRKLDLSNGQTSGFMDVKKMVVAK